MCAAIMATRTVKHENVLSVSGPSMRSYSRYVLDQTREIYSRLSYSCWSTTDEGIMVIDKSKSQQ